MYEGKIYLSLNQVFGGGGALIRRLEASDLLRKPRREIRKVAPKLWPNITEHKVFDINDSDPEAPEPCCGDSDSEPERPARYNNEDMDKWDGDHRWIYDEYLLEGASV